MKKKEKSKIELKDSYFDGFEYKDYKVRTKLVIEGQSEYKPLQLSSSKDVYDAFKGLHESDREKFYGGGGGNPPGRQKQGDRRGHGQPGHPGFLSRLSQGSLQARNP